jgi:GTP-binding protein EngB required for normal cell division
MTDSIQSTERPDAAKAAESTNSTDGTNAGDGTNSMDGIRIDELIGQALSLFDGLPASFDPLRDEIRDLAKRLSRGEIRLAVMGQFKRGKSSFINSLLAMDVLPVSVIPVTSIPTFIREGLETSCTVRFFNKKPDLVVHKSLAEIRAVLTDYVSEQKNPKNRKHVSEAVIECDNPILKNGTVLIDTPGFGSTYVHNTKTTVDLIKGCDAVLFLLSADPPFTQTEVEFLKEMKRYVPRIFFILNKIDQSTSEELATLEPFLRSILVTELGFPPDVTLFRVSARLGRDAEKPPHSEISIQVAGMQVVKEEIIDFMVREKYFALSQAVGEKFNAALDAAAGLCDAQYRELEAPLAAAKQQHDWLRQHCEGVKNRGERELSLIDVELRALVDFVDTTLEKKKKELSAKANDGVRQIIASAVAMRANPLVAVKSSFWPLADEMLNHLFLQVASSVAGPLKKAVDLPFSQFVRTVDEVRRAVPSFSLSQESLKEPDRDAVGLAAFVTSVQNAGTATIFEALRLPAPGLFRSKASVQRRCEEKLLPLAEQLLNEQFERLSHHVKNSIRSICDALKQDLAHNFRILYETMLSSIVEIESADVTAMVDTREKVRLLKERREAFLEIKAGLV